MEDSINLWLKNNLTLIRIIGGVFFLFFIIIPIIKAYFSSDSWLERKNNREKRKYELKLQAQERIELAKEAGERRKREQEEILDQQQKRKEEEFQKVSDFMNKIRQSPINQKWRNDVIEKFGNKCQTDVSHENRQIEVHHLVSLHKILLQNNINNSWEKALNCKLLWDPSNGMVLCKECHDKMESSQNRQAMILKNNK